MKKDLLSEDVWLEFERALDQEVGIAVLRDIEFDTEELWNELEQVKNRIRESYMGQPSDHMGQPPDQQREPADEREERELLVVDLGSLWRTFSPERQMVFIAILKAINTVRVAREQ